MDDNNNNDYDFQGGNFYMKEIVPTETEEKTNDEARSSGPKFDGSGRDGGDTSGAAAFVHKNPNFITRKVFVITIILTLIVSTILSLGALVLLSNSSSTGIASKSISSTNYSLEKATGSELSIQEIIARNENSVVEIRTESVATDLWMQQYITQGAGSGVIIDTKGYILTNNHVIEGANKITVKLHNGEEYVAKLIATDPLTDIAVIQIKASNLSVAVLGDSSKLSVGDLAVAIGNPLGQLGGTATTGIISALDRDLTIDGKKMTLLQTDASINPGNSGGGLFNQYGELIGLVVAKSSGSDVEGLGFAIPSNQVKTVASDLIKNGKISNRPIIGINIEDISDAQAAIQRGYQMTGVYVAKVVNSNATKAGFQPGDMIYYVEDTRIDSSATLTSELNKHKVGDKLKVIVVRDNKTVELKVTLSASE